jgi:hypothetical protein
MSFVERFACLSILSEKSKPTNILLSQNDMVHFFQLIFTMQCHIPSSYWHALTWDLHFIYMTIDTYTYNTSNIQVQH